MSHAFLRKAHRANRTFPGEVSKASWPEGRRQGRVLLTWWIVWQPSAQPPICPLHSGKHHLPAGFHQFNPCLTCSVPSWCLITNPTFLSGPPNSKHSRETECSPVLGSCIWCSLCYNVWFCLCLGSFSWHFTTQLTSCHHQAVLTASTHHSGLNVPPSAPLVLYGCKCHSQIQWKFIVIFTHFLLQPDKNVLQIETVTFVSMSPVDSLAHNKCSLKTVYWVKTLRVLEGI